MNRRFYIDTSAYLCILLGENGHDSLRRELAGAELLSSVLLVLEASRNLVRLSREKLLTLREYQACATSLENDIQQFLLRDLALDLCESRVMPVVSTPRSLDLAHLRTALWFHHQEKLTRFVSLDEELILSARELGLPV
jgi:PIN domain nuclease of toxin-antitoxin system